MNTRPAPETRPDTAPQVARYTRMIAITVASGLAAILLIAVFVIWRNQYLPAVYNAAETSTTPQFSPGFIAIGVLEAASLVLATTIALVAALIAVTGESAYRVGVISQLFAVAAAVLIAVAIPVGILYSFLAVVPLILAAIAGAVASVARRDKRSA